MKHLLRSNVVTAVAVLGLAACTSNPGPKTVAQDVVDGLYGEERLTAEQQQCLQLKLDGYTTDELDAIAAGNENLDYSLPDAGAIETGTPAFQEFVASFNSGAPGVGTALRTTNHAVGVDSPSCTT